jgi:hypothetical protein
VREKSIVGTACKQKKGNPCLNPCRRYPDLGLSLLYKLTTERPNGILSSNLLPESSKLVNQHVTKKGVYKLFSYIGHLSSKSRVGFSGVNKPVYYW